MKMQLVETTANGIGIYRVTVRGSCKTSELTVGGKAWRRSWSRTEYRAMVDGKLTPGAPTLAAARAEVSK